MSTIFAEGGNKKMKYYESKISNVFKGKSFYFIIALCLIAIGVATWMAFDRISDGQGDPSDMNTTENISSAEAPSVPDRTDDTVSANDVGTDASEPYESSEAVSSEEPVPIAPVANHFILPINGNIAKQFSSDTLVYSNTYKDMRLHTGIDIIGAAGDIIKSCGNGTVVAVIDDVKLGKYVELDHGNGVVARYCGLDKVSVEEGATVTSGEKLGTLGTVTDECLDETHLHLEFYKDEQPVDPLSLIYPEE